MHVLKNADAVGRLLAAGLVVAALGLGNAALAQESEPVARVNGQEITSKDLALAEQIFAEQLGNMPDDARRSVLVDALIDMRLVAEAARADGIDETDDFRRQMAFFEEQTLRSIYTDQALAKAVSDQKVRAAYDQQIAALPKVAERRLRHILHSTKADAEATVAALKDGESFEDLARQASLDQMSKENGGDLGYLGEGQVLPEFEAAISGLEPGEFAPNPVETAFGFHVVLLEDTRDRPPPSFEEVGLQIRQALLTQAQRSLLAGLRQSAEVEKLVPDVALPQADDGHQH